MKRALTICAAAVLLMAASSKPASAVSCACANEIFTCNSTSCNPNGILAVAARCDWLCNSTYGCPDFAACPTVNRDFDGDGRVTICGTTAADNIVVTADDNVICAKGGDDVIDASQGGNDLIDAGAGNDTVQAGPGDDYVLGDTGNDCIAGGGGSDTIVGDNGSDGLFGLCLPELNLPCPAPPHLAIGSRMCGGDDNDLIVGYGSGFSGSGHQCIDGGEGQGSSTFQCGFGISGPDCWYAANDQGGPADVVTFRSCSAPFVFCGLFGGGPCATALPNEPVCGCS